MYNSERKQEFNRIWQDLRHLRNEGRQDEIENVSVDQAREVCFT